MTVQSRLGRQIAEVLAALGNQGVPFALIGGLALMAHKVVRATSDVDLLAPATRSAEVDAIATKLGYRCLHRNDDVANYARGDERLDLLWASRPSSLMLLAAATPRNTPFGELPVVSAEGLIGFKLQALVNDPRRVLDLEDIRKLLSANREALDLEAVRSYFRLFNREDLLQRLLKAVSTEGVQEEPGEYADPYARFDDLMWVAEQLCPVWPEKPLWPGSGQRFLI